MSSSSGGEQGQTPTGRALLQRRVAAEHRQARLGQLGCGQARYLGRGKTRFQLLLLATLANLRWAWNWAARQQAAGTRASEAVPSRHASPDREVWAPVRAHQAPLRAAPGPHAADARRLPNWRRWVHCLVPALAFSSLTADFRPRFYGWGAQRSHISHAAFLEGA